MGVPHDPDEIHALLQFATPEELLRLSELVTAAAGVWAPLPGPQAEAARSEADDVGYGGSAGGGKTDLICGLALTEHHRTQVFRREGTELTAVVDRMQELVGHSNGYNGANRIWKLPERQIEFCSAPNPGDERKYRGRPKDLLAIDEVTEFLESQVRFISGWIRHENPRQRKRSLKTFNPPETPEGRWVTKFYGPWLEKGHPDPAIPGELRYFAMLSGVEREVPDGTPFSWDYNGKTEIITPQSRTFYPAKVQDNPYLMRSGYVAQLQSLPEPLRSQLLYGDFSVGVMDSPQQAIPTEWVDIAMDRWKQPAQVPVMESMGVDVARGGRDNSVIATRHIGNWYAKLNILPGTTTPDGPSLAGAVVGMRRNNAPVHIDAIGVGASPTDFLRQAKVQVVPVMASETAPEATDLTGLLRFSNVRSWMWWKMREELDPANNTGVMLPPDDELRRELCAMTWQSRNRTIYMLSREELIKDLGYSPDRATAVVLARMTTPKVTVQLAERIAARKARGATPLDRLVDELRGRR